MLTKRQFLSLYDETVLGIRQIKNNNDKINKSIGVLNQATLYKQTQAQIQVIQQLYKKVDQLIQRMQKNYLDPDTARKIGVVKQQLRIQRDRRQQLLDSVNLITKQYKQKIIASKTKIKQPIANSPRKRNTITNSSIQMKSNDSYSYSKRSQITDIDQTIQSQHNKTQLPLHLSDYDLQIQRKLLHDRSQQLQSAQERMLNIQNIVNQTSNLAYEQGHKLDIISDDLFNTYNNVGLTNNQLEQANISHKKSRKKYIVFSLILLIIVAVVLFLVLGL